MADRSHSAKERKLKEAIEKLLSMKKERALRRGKTALSRTIASMGAGKWADMVAVAAVPGGAPAVAVDNVARVRRRIGQATIEALRAVQAAEAAVLARGEGYNTLEDEDLERADEAVLRAEREYRLHYAGRGAHRAGETSPFVRATRRVNLRQQRRTILEAIENPKNGDLIWDITDPHDRASYRIFRDGTWYEVLDLDGDYGGPYPDNETGQRQLQGNPRWRAEQTEMAGDAREDILAEILADPEIPADKKAAVRAAVKARLDQLWDGGEHDPIKLKAATRRAVKVAMRGGGGGAGRRNTTRRRSH